MILHSAILLRSAMAFNLLKVAGAIYLVYLGIRKLSGKASVSGPGSSALPTKLWAVFREGVFVNLTNPKTALFFFASLPQFVDPTRG